MFKEDFEKERHDREKLAHSLPEHKGTTPSVHMHVHDDDQEFTRVQLQLLHEAIEQAQKQISTYKDEILKLKERLQASVDKEEANIRLEEVTVACEKLKVENATLTQQVKQY